ncbi:ribosome biogenesis GTP-binding protein YihA/YsxC [Porphyromonas sp.]|uniref:ribosome biogenesis GTP-binding protein YihA/YsxC n=1 Tax=Porphyromonas sp. TaxID=1924944 RepID=UPI0026DCC99C|nr:ribosome biogenesis GTP-binding protein YihA/YsxC [Porphyromonas sp.]MDO4771233.1 ribosome biogenesis GTP-binding protein YihA/YsxC [Porphyromonas sp.]
MEIKSAEFVISNTEIDKCPQDGRSEYAFIGRSNVGKSSLINMLTRKKGLAKTSQLPGKTQLINHFLINDDFYIVDLPGYGYAKTSKEKRGEFKNIIYSYIYKRAELTNLFILIDIRHEPLKIDIDFINDMGEHGIPFTIVFTKADKLSKGAAAASVERYKVRLSEDWEELPPMFVTSSEKGDGRDEILSYIESIEKAIRSES